MKFTVSLFHEFQVSAISYDGDTTIYHVDKKCEPIRFCVDSEECIGEIENCFYDFETPQYEMGSILLVFYKGKRFILDKFNTWESYNIKSSFTLIRYRGGFLSAPSA